MAPVKFNKRHDHDTCNNQTAMSENGNVLSEGSYMYKPFAQISQNDSISNFISTKFPKEHEDFQKNIIITNCTIPSLRVGIYSHVL